MKDLSGITFTIPALKKGYREKEFSPVDVVQEVYRRIKRANDNPIWIHLIPERDALRAAEALADEIERHLAEVRNVWTFVSNHFEGFAPETAQRLAQRLGYALPLPSEPGKTLSEQERAQLDLFRNDEARMTNVESMTKPE